MNTFIREILEIVKEKYKTVKGVAIANIFISIGLGMIYLIIAVVISIVWYRNTKNPRYSRLQNFVYLLCIILKIVAAIFYFLGDNSEDITEHAMNWKCTGKCPKILKYTGAIVLGISLALFQPIIPFTEKYFEIILRKIRNCCPRSQVVGLIELPNTEQTVAEPKNEIKYAGFYSGILLLLAFPKIDLVYTLINTIDKAGGKDCGFGNYFLFGITLLIGTAGILVSPVWGKETCPGDKKFMYFFGIVLAPVLVMYILADNAKPMDCWINKENMITISAVRIVFIFLSGVILLSYFVIFLIYLCCCKKCSCDVCNEKEE